MQPDGDPEADIPKHGRTHGEKGQFQQAITDEEIRRLIDNIGGPVVGVPDVAEGIGVSKEIAKTRLNEMCERGDLRCRRVGRTPVYWSDLEDFKPIETYTFYRGDEAVDPEELSDDDITRCTVELAADNSCLPIENSPIEEWTVELNDESGYCHECESDECRHVLNVVSFL